MSPSSMAFVCGGALATSAQVSHVAGIAKGPVSADAASDEPIRLTDSSASRAPLDPWI